jgi:hypothetical protein
MNQHEVFPDPAEIRHVIGASGTFALRNVSGDIRLRGADTEEVVAVARSSRGRGETLPLVVRRGEGSLHIELDQKDFSMFGFGSAWRGHDGVEFDVTLPRGARVEINAVSSDIDVRGLVGDQEYRTVSGDISLEDEGGRVSLTTVSGDIDLEASQPLEPRLATTSGDVELSAPMVQGLQLRTVSGDAELRAIFDAGATHTVETVSGDVSITTGAGLTVDVKRGLDLGDNGGKQRVVGDGSARLRFRSLSGDLNLEGSVMDRPTPPPAQPQAPSAPLPPTPDSLEILRALERGEIDVEEAARRLEGAGSRG